MNIAYIGFPEFENDVKWINIISKEHKVIVIHRKGVPCPFLDPDVRIIEVLPSYYPLSDVVLKRRTLNAIRKIIKDENIQIIHSMYAYPNCFWAEDIHFENHIITTRGSDMLVEYSKKYKNPGTLKEKVIYRYMIRKLERSFNHAKFITSTSTGQMDVIRTFIKDPSKLKLVRTGIDVNKFVLIEEKLADKKKPFVIFSPRSNTPLYNIEAILEAAVLFKTKFKIPFQLVWVEYFRGTDYSTLIYERIKQLKLSNECVALPALSEAEMVQQYQKCDVVISIPETDGMPNSVLESMLMKKPVIVNSLKYDEDIINPETVWKIKKNSPELLADEIYSVYSAARSEKNEKLETARAAVLKFANLKIECEKIVSLYEQMINP